jgi:hypothetical protein
MPRQSPDFQSGHLLIDYWTLDMSSVAWQATPDRDTEDVSGSTMRVCGIKFVKDVRSCGHKAEVRVVRFEISSCTVFTAKSRVEYLIIKRSRNISWLSFSTYGVVQGNAIYILQPSAT